LLVVLDRSTRDYIEVHPDVMARNLMLGQLRSNIKALSIAIGFSNNHAVESAAPAILIHTCYVLASTSFKFGSHYEAVRVLVVSRMHVADS
jgi:hypothetical protein